MSDTRTFKKIFIGKPWPKYHKENSSTDGRITSNRTFAKWRSKIGQLASGFERNGRRRSLRRSKLPAIKDSSAPGRRRRVKIGREIFCFCSAENVTSWEKKMNFYRQNGGGPIFYVMRQVSFCKCLPYCGNFSFRSANSVIDSVNGIKRQPLRLSNLIAIRQTQH